MCEIGSQGGIDGRWHCTAAQVDVLLFTHAEISILITVVACLFLCLHVSDISEMFLNKWEDEW